MADKARQEAIFVESSLNIEDSPLLKKYSSEDLNGEEKEKELTDAEIRQFFRTSGGTREERWAEATEKARQARQRESERSGTSGANDENS